MEHLIIAFKPEKYEHKKYAKYHSDEPIPKELRDRCEKYANRVARLDGVIVRASSWGNTENGSLFWLDIAIGVASLIVSLAHLLHTIQKEERSEKKRKKTDGVRNPEQITEVFSGSFDDLHTKNITESNNSQSIEQIEKIMKQYIS